MTKERIMVLALLVIQCGIDPLTTLKKTLGFLDKPQHSKFCKGYFF